MTIRSRGIKSDQSVAQKRKLTSPMIVGSAAVIIAAWAGPACANSDPITGVIFNNTTYDQTSDAQPTTPVGYWFNTGATFEVPGDYTTGTVTYPGTFSPITLSPVSATELNYSTSFYGSEAALSADFPFGSYTITATGPSLTNTAVTDYEGNYFTNTIPYLANYGALQGANAATGIVVDFPSFTPDTGSSEGFTFFTVYDASGAVWSDSFLSPSTTSLIIPAGTLTPGTDFTYELDFSDRLDGGYNPDLQSYSEQGFDLRTDGSFSTAAATPEPSTWAMLILGFCGLGAKRIRASAAGVAKRLASSRGVSAA